MNAQERKTLQANVNRGAKWMDKNYPGWHKKIKMTKLDMSYGCNCVAGQCIPGGYDGFEYTFNSEHGLVLPRAIGEFDDDGNSNWDALGEMWKVQIRKRRGK